MDKFEEKMSLRWPIITALTSFCLLFLEILGFQYLTFLSNYLSANRVISVALLGVSLGAFVAGLLRGLKWELSLVIGSAVLTFGILLSIVMGSLFPTALTLLELTLLIPFCAASLILSTLISVFPPHKIYAADLVGAGFGVLAAVLTIPLFREEGAFIFLFFIALMLTIALSRIFGIIKNKIRAEVYAILIVAAITLPITNYISGTFNIACHTMPSGSSLKIFRRQFSTAKSILKCPVIISEGSLIERVDILRQRQQRYVTFYNGYGNDHVSPAGTRAYAMDLRFPVGFVDNPDVLVIGPAAEGITKAAKLAARWPLDDNKEGLLVGVEINPAIAKIMKGPLLKYSSYAYNGMELHVEDARSFLERDKKSYDIISCLNTHRIHNIGDIGPPEYLHTYEGLKVILRHLKDNGLLVLEEREITEGAMLGVARFIVTVREVLNKEYNVPREQFPNYIFVMRWRGPSNKPDPYNSYVHLFIKKTPFTESEKKFMYEWREGKHPLDRGRHQWTQYVQTPDETSDQIYAKATMNLDVASAFPPSKYHMEPITDDKPFPYDTYSRREQHINLIEHVGVLTAIVALIPALVFTIILRRKGQVTKIGKFSIISIYLIVLGFAYLLVEIVLMQKFQIFLNSPIYSIAIVLGTMLVASGLGSKFAERLQVKSIIFSFVALLVTLGILSAALGYALESLIFLPFGLRIIIAILIIGAVAFLMGIPFPWGISRIRASSGDAAGALGFGLNGAAGAIATPIALLTSTTLGFSKTYLIGAAAYLICALLVPVIAALKKSND